MKSKKSVAFSEAAQLGSVLQWLFSNHKSRAWLANQFGFQRTWASRLFHGEIACSVPILVKLSELTGVSIRQLAGECLR